MTYACRREALAHEGEGEGEGMPPNIVSVGRERQ